MSLGQKIVEKLHLMQRVEDQISFSVRSNHESEKGYRINEREGPVQVHLVVPDMDKYSFVISKFELFHSDWTSRLPIKEQLRRQSDWIAERVTYLPERFALIELDEINQVAQVRSRIPTQKGETRQYYEILLKKGNTLTLSRYEIKVGDTSRLPVPFLLTEELFSRLIDDLVGIWTN